MISNTRKSSNNTPELRNFSDILDGLKSIANTRVAKIKHQDDNNQAFNSIVGNVDLKHVKWINMDRSEQQLNSDQDLHKPIQIVYDASRKPIGYIAEAPTSVPKPSHENYYIDSILNSMNSKNMIRESEKHQLIKVKNPSESISKPKRIIIRRGPYKTVDMMNLNLLVNSLGNPEVQETIIDSVKRTVTTIYKYPNYNENDILASQLRSPFSQFFSQYFPVVIHDPFQTYYESFTDLIEYGEEADICSKVKENVRQGKDTSIDSKSFETDSNDGNQKEEVETEKKPIQNNHQVQEHRVRRKRSTYAYFPINVDKEMSPKSRRMNNKSGKKNYKRKPFGHKITSTMNKIKVNKESLDQNSAGPESYSGTNISTLKVRRGGVAIAGPGGIATAGSGGTAILEPGQSAYTMAEGENNRRSGGVAVVGPSHKVISVPSIQESHLLNLPPGAKLLTTGPIVYMNPVDKKSST